MTRDSKLWWAGIVCAVILGLATLDGSGTGPTSLAYYGIPMVVAPYLRLAALIIGIVSGKLATSPLPSKADADVIGR
jgi:hypothetical protein